MVELRREDGSSLVWFIGMLVLIVMVCLTLAIGIHQYMFASQLKNLVEEYALASKALQTQGRTLPAIKAYLDDHVLAQMSFKSLEIKELTLIDSKTVRVIGCATWQAPLLIIQTKREICEVALAR